MNTRAALILIMGMTLLTKRLIIKYNQNRDAISNNKTREKTNSLVSKEKTISSKNESVCFKARLQ
jgi:hypothetical protein